MRSKTNLYLAIIFFLVILSLYSPLSAEGQKTEPVPETVSNLEITEQKINLPLKSTLILALKNNLDIKFKSLNPKIAETDILREKGDFDTTFSAQLQRKMAERHGEII